MKRPLDGSLTPRGLSRVQAAYYVGVSTSLFDRMVADGRMPPPREINSRRIWDRHQVDASFDELPGGGDRISSPADRSDLVRKQAQSRRQSSWPPPEQADARAYLAELSKTPGAVVYYRRAMMDRETFRQEVLSRPLGKLARDALQALYLRKGEEAGDEIKGFYGTTREVLEVWDYIEVTREGDRLISWRISEAGIAAVEARLANERGPAQVERDIEL